MARPPSIRDEDLLQAVHDVVRERGVAATTAEIAARAGVSEGTLFHRYKSKNQLFIEALILMQDPPWADALQTRVGEGDVFAHLVELGLLVIANIQSWMPLSMVAASAPEEAGFHRRLAAADSPKRRFERKFQGYFEAELRAGRLRDVDAVILCRTYLGALHSYVFDEFQMRLANEIPTPPRVFVESLVGMLKTGVAPVKTSRR
jgi:AcrR family transcriptional regulator